MKYMPRENTSITSIGRASLFEYKQHEHLFPFWRAIFPQLTIEYDLSKLVSSPPELLIANTFADKPKHLDSIAPRILAIKCRKILLTHNPQFPEQYELNGSVVTLHPKWEHKYPRILPLIHRDINTHRSGITYLGRMWQYKDFRQLEKLIKYPIRLIGYNIAEYPDIISKFESYPHVSNEGMYRLIPTARFLLPLIHPGVSQPYYDRVYSGLFSESISYCIPMILHRSVEELYGFPGHIIYDNYLDAAIEHALSLDDNEYTFLVDKIRTCRDEQIEKSQHTILGLL